MNVTLIGGGRDGLSILWPEHDGTPVKSSFLSVRLNDDTWTPALYRLDPEDSTRAIFDPNGGSCSRCNRGDAPTDGGQCFICDASDEIMAEDSVSPTG